MSFGYIGASKRLCKIMGCSVYYVCLKLMRLDLHGTVFSFHFLTDIEDEACGFAKSIESHISTSVAPYDVSRIAPKKIIE